MIDFDELFTKRSLQIKPGLDRIQRSFEYLQRPAAQIPTVLIGGTNGKGSTSGFLWALLAAQQKKVGLYSSPHLVSFAERYQISSRRLTDADIVREGQMLKVDLPSELYEELSFFELITLIAFRLFDREQLDCQVLEVGLGGRWDATNVADPLLSVLVSVSRDHEEFLGSDLLGILREKIGILRAGRPFLWGDAGEVTAVPGYRELLEEELARKSCPLYVAGEHFAVQEDLLYLRLPGYAPLELRLEGELGQLAPYLKSNLALAAAAYLVFAREAPGLALKPIEEVWKNWTRAPGPAPVTLLGRCQKLSSNAARGQRRLCLDVCHNPDGARRFVEAWQKKHAGQKVPALISILGDKDSDGILDILRPQFEPIVLYQTANERTWSHGDIAERHRDLPFVPDLESAWQMLTELSGSTDQPWVACGSVFAVGRLLHFVGIEPQELSLERVLSGDWV